MYNFDEIINRNGTDSVKYDELDINFGKSDLMPFWVADMDFRLPNFAIDALLERAEHGVFGYTRRSDEYYNSIINWLKSKHDFQVKADDIEYGPGVVFLLNMMIRLFTNKGDKIIIQPPVYYPFFGVIEGNERVIVENKLVEVNGKYVMDYEDLEEKAKDPDVKMLILCSPHNPMGRVWTKEELEKLGRICIDNDVLVVSDEIHFDLVFKPNKHIPFGSISEEFKMKSITCTAPSKTFNIAGLHNAYCIIHDKSMMEKYRKELKLLDLNRNNTFSTVIAPVLYNNGKEWLDELLNYLKANMDFVCNYVSENFEKIKTGEIEGTYLMLLDCRELELNSDELDNLFVDAGIALDSGHWFGENGKGFMRLNLACPRSMLETALEKLKEAIEK
jgi:cystathionine beta-lyase